MWLHPTMTSVSKILTKHHWEKATINTPACSYEVGLIIIDEFESPTAKGTLYLPDYTGDWDKKAPRFEPRYLAALSTVNYNHFEKLLDSVTPLQTSFSWAMEIVDKSVERQYIEKPVYMIPNAERKVVEETFGGCKEVDWVRR
jgi:hypothetical protein